MHQPSLTKYAAYVKEKIGAELIEWDNAWATYFIGEGYLFICDFWVDPSHRLKDVGTELLATLSLIAKRHDCTSIRSSVMVNSNDCTGAVSSQIKRGFVITGSNNEKIFLVKEL